MRRHRGRARRGWRDRDLRRHHHRRGWEWRRSGV